MFVENFQILLKTDPEMNRSLGEKTHVGGNFFVCELIGKLTWSKYFIHYSLFFFNLMYKVFHLSSYC